MLGLKLDLWGSLNMRSFQLSSLKNNYEENDLKKKTKFKIGKLIEKM